MLREKRVKIGESEYLLKPLPVEVALETFTRLCNLAGPFASGLGGSIADVDVGQAVSGLLRGLPPGALIQLANAFAASCDVLQPRTDGGPALPIPLAPMLSTHFQGRFGELMQWLGHCISYNFTDFLDAIKPLSSKLMQAKA